MVALLSLGALACDRPAPRPERELLFITSDSTFWVTSTGEERRARGVPMLVARIGGRFTELYVTDDDRSYYDAVFIGHRLFARDLVRGDSVELHRDTVVAHLAAEYTKTHPDDQPLSPDEPENDNASIRASSDIEILGIHGIYVSYEHHTDVDSRDERSSDHRHQYRRGVLDTRDGSRVTLAQLFGKAVADTLAAAGRREWNTVRDSVIARGAGAERVRKAIADFAFDAASFAIGSDGQSPTVRFAPPALSVNPDIEPIELQPRRVSAPTWWAAAAAELPLASGDSGQWVHGGDTLSVRLASAPRGWSVALRIAGASERVVARVSTPVERVIWLDSTVSDAEREALARAFAEAGDYDGQRQIVSAPRAVTPFLAPLATPRTAWHLARHAYVPTFRQRQAGARVQARVVRADDAGRRERAWSRVWWRNPRDARQDGGCLRHAARPDALRHGIG